MMELFLIIFICTGLILFFSRLYLHGIEDGREQILNSLYRGQTIEFEGKSFSVVETKSED